MNIVFRADASLDIGTGHVMRCLTLADALRERGAQCQFICRAHVGHLAALIEQRGHGVTLLPLAASSSGPDVAAAQPAHAAWLGRGITQEADALDTLAAIGASAGEDSAVGWLVVDHYALDSRWESLLRPASQRLMVIDDLADRPHDCDLLLDQNLGRQEADYAALVSVRANKLIGPAFALLRPEFAQWRSYSLNRRAAQPGLRHLLITMGGVDKDNATGQALQILCDCPLPADCQITVVMGATAPWLKEVRTQAQNMPWPTRVLVGVNDMAQLMADSDLAIGAAGATSWERCCLGLPSIMLVLAENQREIAQALSKAGAAHMADAVTLLNNPLITPKIIAPKMINTMSIAAANITDGLGAKRTIDSFSSRA
jgi:UDP-2,4-diacetamido-2,4,6-trideoxy-beta-L-altropyranose hydrolase